MKGIIFDIDGTLWDSREPIAKAWNEAVFINSGIKTDFNAENLKHLFGKPMDVIFNTLLPQFSEDERRKLSEQCCEYENNYLINNPGTLYDNIEDTLKILYKQYSLYIVSNCHRGYIPVFLLSTGLKGYFKDSLCPGDTGKLKAENIDLIIKRNNITDAVYIGDTQTDLDSARKAKIKFIFAEYGFGSADSFDAKIKCFSDIPNTLKNIGF